MMLENNIKKKIIIRNIESMNLEFQFQIRKKEKNENYFYFNNLFLKYLKSLKLILL